ncbi:MAG: DUF4430 domain-containing protein [Ruminococcaceae bacterium]|nr:DUF4430 domain-containing protein [Oscillospiraceae bacterium]
MSFIKKYLKIIGICLCIALVFAGALLICEKSEIPQDTIVASSNEITVDTEKTQPAPINNEAVPIVEEKPATAKNVQLPEEKTEENISKDECFCTVSIRCDTMLSRKEQLMPEKLECIPENGIILDTKEVRFSDGDTVFDILKAVTKKEQIHLEFVMTPAYNSAYIEGINNIYEFDGGELSGWTYRVNGINPNVGCSECAVKSGDVIEWLYTCDMGRDLV